MNIIIDGKRCEAEYREFILTVARRNNIYIPTLCHSDALPGQANCRLCIVDIEEDGRHKIVASCVYPITKEIIVSTNTPEIIDMRKTIIMLLAARVQNNAYINKLMQEYGVNVPARFKSDPHEQCILCGLCVRACEKLGSAAIATVNRGIEKKVATPYDQSATTCIGCASCARVCPTGAIKVVETEYNRTIWHKTFELIACANCHEKFITKEEQEFLRRRLPEESNGELCAKCRQALTAQKLKDVFANTAGR